MLRCAGLQQQLAAAHANRQGCEAQLTQQLQQLQALHLQAQGDLAREQEQRARLQNEVGSLGQALLLREQELRQAQVRAAPLGKHEHAGRMLNRVRSSNS
jgi:hypothetical protein